jgi:hypothetical protein
MIIPTNHYLLNQTVKIFLFLQNYPYMIVSKAYNSATTKIATIEEET